MRLAGNLAFFWLLRLLWPKRAAETVGIALLFSVYPGFTVQPNAGVYVTDLLANAAALLSFCLMLKAMQSSRRAGHGFCFPCSPASLELLYLGSLRVRPWAWRWRVLAWFGTSSGGSKAEFQVVAC